MKIELPPQLNALSERVIGCAIEVHRALGPGLAEAIYETALARELELASIPFARQVAVHAQYKGVDLPVQRLDLVIDAAIVLELKATDKVADQHLAQLVSYLNYAHLPLGLLINFNTPVLSKSIYRRINSRVLQPQCPSSAPSASALRPLRASPPTPHRPTAATPFQSRVSPGTTPPQPQETP